MKREITHRTIVAFMLIGAAVVIAAMGALELGSTLKRGTINYLREASYRHGYRQGYFDARMDRPNMED